VLHQSRVICLEQVKRFEYYCQFIKRIFIRRPLPSNPVNEWHILAEIFLQIEHSTRPLCPRLEDIKIGSHVTSIRGGYIILERFASSSTKTVTLQFAMETISTALLSRYLETIARKSDKITSLEVFFLYPNTERELEDVTNTQVLRVHSPDCLDSFGKMVALDTLSLDAHLLTLELLDSIGDLPHLQVLKVPGPLCRDMIGNNVQPRRDKFPSLAQLKIRGEIYTLKNYFMAYFSLNPGSVLSKLDISLEDTPTRKDDFTFFKNLPQGLREIQLDIFHGGFPLQFRYLDWLGACKELALIRVTHPLFMSFQGFNVAHLRCCQNLTRLHLYKQDYAKLLLAEDLPAGDPWGLSSIQPDGADIYILGVLAESLPRLIELWITVVASPTRRSGMQDIVPFQQLEHLIFGSGSFVNHRQSGFDEDEAARYISDLVLPTTTIDLDYIEEYKHPTQTEGADVDFDLAWDYLIDQHRKFGIRFGKRIADYVQGLDV
jgi:hypothetical protein